MIRLGEVQKLKVLRKVSIGMFLNASDKQSGEEDILLPNNQLSQDIKVGDELEVFVYKDSEDRLIATRKKPHLTLGEIAILRVVQTSNIGAFLDWGLEKDLFLPYREQTLEVQKEDRVPVRLYIDKSDRLSASMYLADALRRDSPYKENARATGVIYSLAPEVGAFVAVDNKFDGVIPTKELYGDYKCGDTVEVRIKKIRQNGRLELSLREQTLKQMDKDAEVILHKLALNGGILNLNDKSDPDFIKAELNMSKAAFKRAVGRLYKEQKVRITDSGIEKIEKKTL